MIIFETAIVACAIAWGEKGIVGVQLPEADAAATQARLQKRVPLAGAAGSRFRPGCDRPHCCAS
ncbi:hypothetical protein [Phyllobacterium salinisoli]|uniref:hypothetical protein n=1 Tax=Phyllobacterium salinisoli TaxID=1899321 RepID=UPI001FE05C0B|nr:hypothetical protein [Phyllobacterium salinisoli]